MEEELSTACRAAADALEILSYLRPGFTRNVIPRINSSTAISVSQANSGERQVNDEELHANESAVESSTSPASSSSIQDRLATLFPTVGSNRFSRKDTTRRPAKSKRTIKSTKGPPFQDTFFKGSSPYSQSQNQQSAYTYNPASVRREGTCLPRVSFWQELRCQFPQNCCTKSISTAFAISLCQGG